MCCVLHIGNQRTKPHANLVLGDNVQTQVDNAGDLGLGVTADSHLKFDMHINLIITRAHRLSNVIHKCFASKDPPTLVHAFTAYVRLLLEYASCVWSPYTVRLVNKVESVQRRFTKHFVCCYGLTYSQRLTKLRTENLQLCRLYLDLIYVYKILFGMVETEVSTHFVLHKLDTGIRDHSLKIFAHHSRIDARKHFSVIVLYSAGIVCLLHLLTSLH